MKKFHRNVSKWFGKVTFVLVLIALFSNSHLIVSAESSAAAKKDALDAVVNFLNAQKNCNVDDMINYSEYSPKMSNVKEFYSFFCKENPLQQAKVTDLIVINDSLALVSIESTYKDKIFISRSPVMKKNGQWKIIKGIKGPGYVHFSNTSNKGEEEEVKKTINDYSNAVKSGDVTEMRKYIKESPQMDIDKLEKHLKAISEGPSPEVTPFGIEIISDTLAITQIETKYEHFSFTQNYAVCKENGQWKIVFGHNLMNSAIPTSDKPVEIK